MTENNGLPIELIGLHNALLKTEFKHKDFELMNVSRHLNRSEAPHHLLAFHFKLDDKDIDIHISKSSIDRFTIESKTLSFSSTQKDLIAKLRLFLDFVSRDVEIERFVNDFLQQIESVDHG